MLPFVPFVTFPSRLCYVYFRDRLPRSADVLASGVDSEGVQLPVAAGRLSLLESLQAMETDWVRVTPSLSFWADCRSGYLHVLLDQSDFSSVLVAKLRIFCKTESIVSYAYALVMNTVAYKCALVMSTVASNVLLL